MVCMPKKTIRCIMNTILSNKYIGGMNIFQTTVAFYRPKSIKGLLSKAKLYQEKSKVSVYIPINRFCFVSENWQTDIATFLKSAKTCATLLKNIKSFSTKIKNMEHLRYYRRLGLRNLLPHIYYSSPPA